MITGIFGFGEKPRDILSFELALSQQLPFWLRADLKHYSLHPFNIVMVDCLQAGVPLVELARQKDSAIHS